MFAQVVVPVPLSPLGASLDYLVPDNLKEDISKGSLVTVPFRNKSSWGVVIGFTGEPSQKIDPGKIKPIDSIKLSSSVFDDKDLELLHWISQQYYYPIGEVAESMIPAPVRKGSQKTLTTPKALLSGTNTFHSLSKKIIPNGEQLEAIKHIFNDSRPHLLWGVTGSGKTQVYIESISRVLLSGRGAMVLVPEIALTPQLLSRFEEAFPGQIAVFHSAQKPTELRRAWLEVFNGNKKIVLGARSALFAPLKNLGILILDEEHDSSYKQEERLKYHAREVAEKLAELRKAKLVLGSATPSAESLFKVSCGKWTCSRLEKRAVDESKLPKIEIVDLKDQLAKENLNIEEAATAQVEQSFSAEASSFFLSSKLKLKIQERLDNKEQTILFLNRRGMGSGLICKSCGGSVTCPTCHISLTPHKRTLLCHFCGFQTNTPKQCKECGAGDYPHKKIGTGTEDVESILSIEFPSARVLRLDRDSATNQSELETVLDTFSSGKADILVGTQMVAKGHDFPKVTLVGMIMADMGLQVPDFRASEKSLQLLLQVAGRAGRSSTLGEVVVQTFNPDHRVFRALSTYRGLNSYSEFLEVDLLEREALGYPPYGELILIRFDGLVEHMVKDAAHTVALALSKVDPSVLQVLGPAMSYYSRVRGRYRYHVLIKSKSREHLNKSMQWIWDTWITKKLEAKFKTRLSVDASPVSMS